MLANNSVKIYSVPIIYITKALIVSIFVLQVVHRRKLFCTATVET